MTVVLVLSGVLGDRIPILSSTFAWIRIKLAASCPLCLLSQATSVPCPPSNISHSTSNLFT
ncbi:hypothetical protein AMECASPLE_030515, partial [Ameca splendens]